MYRKFSVYSSYHDFLKFCTSYAIIKTGLPLEYHRHPCQYHQTWNHTAENAEMMELWGSERGKTACQSAGRCLPLDKGSGVSFYTVCDKP